MKKLFMIAVLIFLSLLTINQTIAQTTGVTVKLWDNSEQQFQLSNSGKFYFQNSNLIIDEGNGTTTPIAIANIRRITLQAGNSIENYTATSNFLIYPNPTSDKLFFATDQNQMVEVAVYGLNGQLLQKSQINTSDYIDVSNLAKGFYVIKINEQSFKFSKL